MFKSFLIFLWLFILILFWVYLFGDSQEDLELSNRYSEYLSWAIMRNTPNYDVEIDAKLFIEEKTTSNEEFIEQLDQQELWNQTDPNLFSYNRVSNEENKGLEGNFWTPRIETINRADTTTNPWSDSSCNWWLIYDPCIVLWEPIKVSWWMNFGSKKYN